MEWEHGREQYHTEANRWLSRLAIMMVEAADSDDPQYFFINEAYRQAQTDLQLYDAYNGTLHKSHYDIG